MQHGALAVPGGRDISPIVNRLLALPFILKIATKDFHPVDHVSFSTSHDPPNNKAFESTVVIKNAPNPSEQTEIPIWPPHCVQGSRGADLIPEIDVSKFDHIVEKGRDKSVEMFSAFADVFGNKKGANIDLGDLLRQHTISHVYVVGLAGDYCVKCTAIDAQTEGFNVCVIEDGTRSIDSGPEGWGAIKQQLYNADVGIVAMTSSEVKRLESTFD